MTLNPKMKILRAFARTPSTPLTALSVAKAARLGRATVYVRLSALLSAGAIKAEGFCRQGKRGSMAACYRLTAKGRKAAES